MKASLVTTVLNEEETIIDFLDSIARQTKMPDEIIIVDGGSTDGTLQLIKTYPNLSIKLLQKKGNRSVGRNTAIRKAKADIIAISDGDCVLDKGWLEETVKPFSQPGVECVAGYYQGKATSLFEKCLIPYVLVMPDRVDSTNFLPASRSMAILKSAWEKVGGFPEEFSLNEDYVFANRLKKSEAKIVFAKKAIVSWRPRKNLAEAFRMFFRFARGDAQAGLYRAKVGLLFGRYLLGAFLLLAGYYLLLGVAFLLYLGWAVAKNFKYVGSLGALVVLPLLQLTADVAVLAGTIAGLVDRLVPNG